MSYRCTSPSNPPHRRAQSRFGWRNRPGRTSRLYSRLRAGRAAVGICLASALVATATAAPSRAATPADYAPEVGRRGGRLVLAVTAEPRTFHPYYTANRVSQAVIGCTTLDLLTRNKLTQRVEPGVAASWTASEDGRTYTFELRHGLRFSDGTPMDADDVVFSYRALLAAEPPSPLRSQFAAENGMAEARKIDSHRVEIRLRRAAGPSLFTGVPILPEHLLGAALTDGSFSERWGLQEDPSRIAGLGAFRIAAYEPGQRVVLQRNPHYARRDDGGAALPYLDEVVFTFAASDDAALLRFLAGETDLANRLTSEGYNRLRQSPDEGGRYRSIDVGPGFDFEFLFFNLNDSGEDEELEKRKAWFRDVRFRHAVSLAIDREAIRRLVYQGYATIPSSFVSPTNRAWFNSSLRPLGRSLDEARRLLTEAGFRRTEAGLVDATGAPVRFSLLYSASNSRRRDSAALIRQDLGELGIEVVLAGLEHASVVDRILARRDYDAAMLGLGAGDPHPDSLLAILGSARPMHIWHPQQSEPATDWEAAIDNELETMSDASTETVRKQAFDRIQQIMMRHEPLILLAHPHVLVAAKTGIGNLHPAVLEHHLLWNADELFWKEKE